MPRLGKTSGLRIIHEVLNLTGRVDGGAWIAPLLMSLKQRYDPSDMGRLTDLVYGIQRWRGWADHVISSCAKRNVTDISPPILNLLRCSVYQLTFSRRPVYAVVNESVETVKSLGNIRAVPFVNGVLRKITRSFIWDFLPESGEPEYLLSIKYSHPRWLVSKWLKNMGRTRTESVLKSNQQAPRTCLMVNLKKITRGDLQARLERDRILTEPLPNLPAGLEVIHGNPVRHLPKYRGLFYIQDAGSQMLGWLAASIAGDRVIDLCSAPGGKSFSLKNHHTPSFQVLHDVHLARLNVARGNAEELSMEKVVFVCGDGVDPPFSKESVDTVIVDAPCSGLGTLGKNPEIRWRLSEKDLLSRRELQIKLLRSALELVRSGGKVLYSTCSMEPEENEETVFTILKEKNDCKINILFGKEFNYISSFIDQKGIFRRLPDKTSSGYTGFIIAKN